MKKSLFVILVGCGSTESVTENDSQDTLTDESETWDTTDTSEPFEEDSATDTQPDSENPPQPEPQDYSVEGSYLVIASTGSVAASGCEDGMTYDHFIPEGVDNPPFLVLGHGFLRSGKMVGWGSHLASWGIEVVAPELCHFNVLTGVDHELNGVNLVELANDFGRDEVIYGGQSAGGLAAIIAAAQDPNAIGLLGLDATDTEGVPSVPDFIGQSYAGSVSTPAYGLVGEPSSCNSNNNGIALYAMMENPNVVRVTSSDHCDYENPTDWLCTSLCTNEGVSFSDESIATVIKHLGTAAVLSLSGDSDAAWQWSADTLSPLIGTGQVEFLQ